MDSQFVNYDGRSVHDMIQLLLSASGDPEAIARLQQAIQTVDAKFNPVNTELARLETDKQNVGKYATFNGVTQTEMLLATMSNYRMQIIGTDEDTSKSMIVTEPESGRILLYDKRAEESSVSLKATFTADYDSGWIDAEKPSGASGTVKYRKKNGKVIVHLSAYSPPADYGGTSAGGQDVFTLPVGFRPETNTFFTLVNGSWENIFTMCIRGNTGIVQIKSNTGDSIPKTTVCYGTVEFTSIV